METPKRYKAKIKGTNRYIRGYYFKHQLVIKCPITSVGEKDKEPEYQHCIVFDEMVDWGLEPQVKVAEIDIDTLEEAK